MMRGLVAAVLMGTGALVSAPTPALAEEQVDITAPAPVRRAPEPIVIPPGDHGAATRPSDADYYRQPPKVRHDPAFVGPLSTKTERGRGTGRMGVAGWTSPSTPVGSPQTGYGEVNGWFAFGFAYEWNGPPAPEGAGEPGTR